MKDIDRRSFIKLTAAAIGGAMLTGCSFGGGSDSGATFPNGYRFYRIKSTGETVGTGSRNLPIDYFYGSTHISSNGIITFDARDSGETGGIFQLGVDFTGTAPKIEWERCALLPGDTLADNRTVARARALDVDDSGNIATVIDADGSNISQHFGSGLYLDTEQKGFEPVLIAGDEFEDGELYATGTIGDVDLHENSRILAVVSHSPNSSGSMPGQSLLHLPDASLKASRSVMTTGDVITGTEHEIVGLGLVDLNDNNNFAVSSHSSPLTAGIAASATDGESFSQCTITGNLDTPSENQLLTASLPVGAGTHTGDSGFGPRMGADGTVYTKITNSDESETLIHDEKVLLKTGDMSLDGNEILGFSTGSVGADGIYYYTLYSNSETGISLAAYNGGEHRILLSRGDVLADGGAPVENILFGTTTKHVDSHNRLIMLCEFTDGSVSLVAGIPC